MRKEEKKAHEIYMAEQMKHPMQFGCYTLPEQWQLDAMEAYANSKMVFSDKFTEAIQNMIGKEIKRCTYYHKAATFVETDKGKLMIRVEYYDPPKVVMDDVALLTPTNKK